MVAPDNQSALLAHLAHHYKAKAALYIGTDKAVECWSALPLDDHAEVTVMAGRCLDLGFWLVLPKPYAALGGYEPLDTAEALRVLTRAGLIDRTLH